MFCIKLLVVLTVFGVTSKALTKKWKFTNNILDPKNWEGGAPSENCKGVIFPYNLGTVGSLYKLYADEVVLPFSGEIVIKDGGFIEIAQNSPCLRITELQFFHWFSPDSWISSNNSAVPDVERVPCMEDDVIFPPGNTVSVYYPEIPVQVHSLQIDGINLTNNEWQHFLQTDVGDSQFITLDDIRTTDIKIQQVVCISPGGCLCHGLDDVLPWVCEKVPKQEAQCFDPVTPVGHCNQICGALLHLSVTDIFSLQKFLLTIPKYENVDVHASKVLQGENVFLQMVFVDKYGYNEYSTNAAYKFHEELLKDFLTLGIKSATLYTSGMRLPKNSSMWSIILGTLLASCILCTMIYLSYVGSLQKYNIFSRFPIREISFKNVRPLWFSKFENREDGRVSIAPSCISLDKAFSNPMFNMHRPSASSEAEDVGALFDDHASTSIGAQENQTPSHEQYIEVIDIIEEAKKGLNRLS